MADAYLNMAETVLRSTGVPLRPSEMIALAYASNLLPWHLFGSRQDKTLHARLSEDIARNRENSAFCRTAPGTFFLRELLTTSAEKIPMLTEYYARPRKKELKRDYVLTVRSDDLTSELENEIILPIANLHSLIRDGRYSYRPFSEVFLSERLIAVHSFVVVFHGMEVLSYRTGKFRPTTDPLYGSRSIGLGGTVFAKDVDLLFESMAGIVANGIDELCYGIGLPMRLAERARYENEMKPWLGVLVKKGPRHPSVMHVVMGYSCPSEFAPTKAALSINDLRWIDLLKPANTFDQYDDTSKELLSTGRIVSLIEGAASQ
ncbi:winged helix-turn-helix domain-containing protein [Brucella intermedia]|uniref:HTH domain-containing protein n=1 Tax=Brucella intermedia TaxID=94625 RepID=UPI00209B6888|nr:HTH domain-containing protein [Brucella intermedia]MCO7729108.1 winged helix-turn-helix domain-containing protein [Brucella intermedia]